MCGINGIVSKNGVIDIETRIKKMNESIKHRGPDAGGTVILNESRFAFGQRRLAIVDIDSRSNQPFWSNDKSTVLIFNGEIYNYKELRKKIEYQFKTESDTEVLLAGLKLHGVNWLGNSNGMFAIAYYDINKKELVLARDRFGIKPLYYYNDGKVLVFSSEIKGILNSGLVSAEFNYDAIDEYLGNRYVREPYTFFKNIYQLPAGTYVKISENLDMNPEKYWSLPDKFNTDEIFNEDNVYEAFKEKLNDAIKKRMIADVTVGTYLSGGIDSSIISAVASKEKLNEINTYTIGFSECNEFQYARKVAEKYNTCHHEILMNESNYFEMMEEIIKYKDAPLAVPNEIPLAKMSRFLRRDITVVLSGEGADELLGGYGRIFRAAFDYKNNDKNRQIDFYHYFINKYEYVPRKIRDKYLRCNRPLREKFDKEISKDFEKHINEENIFRFFHTYHIKGLLQRVDTTTMYASVEARVPFLDHELVEFCYRNVPYSLKLKWKTKADEVLASEKEATEYSEILDEPKYLLRKYGLELLPEEVVIRKKEGFPVPLNAWLNEIQEMARKLLRKTYWLKDNIVDELCEECKNDARAGQILWMFINIEIFKKIYFKKNWLY